MTSNTEAETRPWRPFRFQDLPRELRDMVYGLLTIDHEDIANDGEDHDDGRVVANIRSGPIATMLRVQRQFSSEYTEQVLRSSSLQVADDHAEPAAMPDLPNNIFNFVNRAECVLLACCLHWQADGAPCALFRHTGQHLDLIKKLQGGLRRPLATSINFYISGLEKVYDLKSSMPEHDLREDLEDLVSVAGVQRVVVHYSADEPFGPWTSSYDMTTIKCGEWTKAEGWQSSDESEKV